MGNLQTEIAANNMAGANDLFVKLLLAEANKYEETEWFSIRTFQEYFDESETSNTS